MGENLVLDDGSVIIDIDIFNGKSRDFGQKNTAKGIGDGSINVDKRERCFER